MRKLIVAGVFALAAAGVGGVSRGSEPVEAPAYEAVVQIYGPYASREAADAAAGKRSHTGGYLTAPLPGSPGVRYVGYRGRGFYFWY